MIGRRTMALRAIWVLIFMNGGLLVSSQQPPKKVVKEMDNTTFTFLNATGNCMFYAKRIYFVVYNFTQNLNGGSDVETYSIPLKPIIDTKASGKCSEYSGDLTLNLKAAADGRHNLNLDSLIVKMRFNYSQALNWWYIDGINITGTGSIFVNDSGKIDLSYNQSQSRGYIDGPKSFCYACGQQRPFIFYTRPNDSKKEKDVKLKYGISFTNLQIQPFRINNTRGKNWYGFTEDVYDCVPFMSAGVWMFLVSASILLCIVLCGISMLASLKTNDRFDDIKGKTLVINVKE